MKGGKSECNSLIGGTNNKFDDFLFQEKQKIKKILRVKKKQKRYCREVGSSYFSILTYIYTRER